MISIRVSSKAFYTVPREMLCKGLERVGYTPHFVAIVRSLHSDVNSLVNFNGALAEPLSIVNWVKQGSVLVPQLFAIFFFFYFAVIFKII